MADINALSAITSLFSLPTTGGVQSAAAAKTQTTSSGTPPLDQYLGLSSSFLNSPAGGTALLNNILFASSNQQVPVDFLKNGFYTGVPPLFGGKSFGGLPQTFDFFNAKPGPVGVDTILGLEKQLKTSQSTLSAQTATAKAADTTTPPAKTTTPSTNGSLDFESLKNMTLGDFLKLFSPH